MPIGIQLGEPGIAFRLQGYAGQVEALRNRLCLGIQLRAADQHQLVHTLFPRPGVGALQGGLQRGKHLGAFQGEARLAADHQVEPAGQRAAQRVPGLAAHDDRLAEGHGLEVLEVRRQVPGHAVVDADHAVFREGGDHGEGEQGLIHGREDSQCPARAASTPFSGYASRWNCRRDSA
ncbi:hypothetical protein D9M71_241520 [compost metagenome]